MTLTVLLLFIVLALQSCSFSFSTTFNLTTTPTPRAQPQPSPTQGTLATFTPTATRAIGELAFFNQATGPITLPGGVIQSKHGVAIQFAGPVTVPVFPDPNAPAMHVKAFAVIPGSQGNIPAHDVDGPCCAPGITVKNFAAFSGGKDAPTSDSTQQGALPLLACAATSQNFWTSIYPER